MSAFLIDRNVLMRVGLKILSLAQGLSIAGEADSVRQACQCPRLQRSNLIVLVTDIAVEQVRSEVEQLKASRPNTALLVVSNLKERDYVKQILLAGADGFLVKWASVKEFVEAVNQVRNGGCYLHSEVITNVISDLRDQTPEARDAQLKPRDLQILRLMALGHSNAQIATNLFVSVSTVKNHVRSLFQKFSACDRTQLIAEVMKKDLLERDGGVKC